MEGLHLNMTIYPFCERFGLATVAVQVQDLLNYTMIDPMVQRKLSAGQRRKIANYLQERELDRVFFGPVTLSLREVERLSKDEQGLVLVPGSKLSILDGQHRLLSLGYVNDLMIKEVRSYEKKLSALKIQQRRFPESAEVTEELEQMEGTIKQLEKRRLELMESELAVQIYIGLSEVEEGQLFGDINSKVLLVSKELGHSFDSTDPLNLVIQQVANHNLFLKGVGVERRANLNSFNKNFTSLSWLYATAAMLYSGKTQRSYELARQIRHDLSTYIEILHQFFSTILPQMPEQSGHAQYSSSSRLMQESIALFAFTYLFQDRSYNKDWSSCLDIFQGFDWSHDNQELSDLFGNMGNGKINFTYESSLRKHNLLVQLFGKMLGDNQNKASTA
jgi:hypothetical protein